MATKVVTLSADDPVAARTKFREWLDKKDKILIVVLNDTQIARSTVEKADVLSGGVLNEPRWVIHAPVREHVMEILITLKDPEGKIKDWDKVLAYSLSLTDNIRDMIVRDGTEPTRVRIGRAYLEAEKD